MLWIWYCLLGMHTVRGQRVVDGPELLVRTDQGGHSLMIGRVPEHVE